MWETISSMISSSFQLGPVPCRDFGPVALGVAMLVKFCEKFGGLAGYVTGFGGYIRKQPPAANKFVCTSRFRYKWLVGFRLLYSIVIVYVLIEQFVVAFCACFVTVILVLWLAAFQISSLFSTSVFRIGDHFSCLLLHNTLETHHIYLKL